MSGQWGKSDAASNSVLWAPSYVNKTPNSANRDALFGNTTPDAFITGVTEGVFGVDAIERSVGSGNVAQLTITSPGSGYTANAVVTITGGGGASATANSVANATGRISTLNITVAGSSYETNPSVSIAAPTAVSFAANTALSLDALFNSSTGVANTTEYITTASAHGFTNGDVVQYVLSAGNTATVGGLSSGSQYFVVGANTTAVQLADTANGTAINITASTAETGHILRRIGFISIASNVFQSGDIVTYNVTSNNTTLAGLTPNTQYFIVNANTSGVYLSTTSGGARILLTPAANNQSAPSLTGQTATAAAVVGGAANKGVHHAGWVLRTVGSGGRAGRVQYETLVAMGSIGTDAADDTILPDA